MKRLLTVCMMLAALTMIAFADSGKATFDFKNASQYDIAARIEQLLAEVDNLRLTGGDQTEVRAEIELLRNVCEPMLTNNGSALDLACADCAPAHVDLGNIGTTVYGYFVSGDLGTDGKWVASFNGVAGGVYYWDLCPTAPGTGTNAGFSPNDIDIRIKTSACALATNGYVDGSCSAPAYSPNNWSWTCATTGTYYIELKDYNSGTSSCNGTALMTFTLNYYAITPTPPPVNDQCGGALPLAVPGLTTGSTQFATNDYDSGIYGTCPYTGSTAKDVVYTYTPAVNEAVTFDLCGSSYDTKIYIATECPPVNLIACDDDGCPAGCCTSYLNCVSLAGGVTYYIFVDGYSSSSGAFALLTSVCSSVGRCCYTDESGAPGCADNTAEECAFLGGAWDNTLTCNTPCPLGQCCYVLPPDLCNPLCAAPVLEGWCDALGGVWTEGGACETPCPVDCYCTCSAEINTHCQLGPYAITDYACVDVPIFVGMEYHITDVNLCFDITHTFDGDLDIYLVSPLGTIVELSTDNGGSGMNYICTTLDDEATNLVTAGLAPFTGSYVPEFPLAGFDGENALGTWILRVCDDAGGDVGTVNWACLTFTYDYILPVEFGSFDWTPGDNMITLSWNTESESNMSHFEVMRGAEKITEVACTNTSTNHNYSYVDRGVTNGVAYSYTLIAVDLEGIRATLATVNASPNANGAVVTEYALHQNFPNPFNPETNIAFDLVEAGHVNVTVFNVMGQKVAELVNGNMSAGRHIVSFDASNLSSGLYLYKMEANGFTAQMKMILMK